MPPALADSGVTITLYGRLTGLLTLTKPLTDGCALETGEGSSSSGSGPRLSNTYYP